MSTPPPPPEPPSTARVVLKVALYAFGALVLLVLVGAGLLAATCSGLTR